MATSNERRSPCRRLLVIKHGAFGDLIQADGALRDLRAAFPRHELVLLTSPPRRTGSGSLLGRASGARVMRDDQVLL
ncbi:hypothetical protein [Aquimonas voraii]|uniref:hypothetical protein n=1 Tax=Aquimonas voraii TaxID=265719 RepID=UPI000A7D9FBE|nr:hypothetical protein [Aquimonas voraii]